MTVHYILHYFLTECIKVVPPVTLNGADMAI